MIRQTVKQQGHGEEGVEQGHYTQLCYHGHVEYAEYGLRGGCSWFGGAL